MIRMIGQLSHEEFCSSHPTASVELIEGTFYAVTKGGRYTVNSWIQHDDKSWTNYYCGTLD